MMDRSGTDNRHRRASSISQKFKLQETNVGVSDSHKLRLAADHNVGVLDSHSSASLMEVIEISIFPLQHFS